MAAGIMHGEVMLQNLPSVIAAQVRRQPVPCAVGFLRRIADMLNPGTPTALSPHSYFVNALHLLSLSKSLEPKPGLSPAHIVAGIEPGAWIPSAGYVRRARRQNNCHWAAHGRQRLDHRA